MQSNFFTASNAATPVVTATSPSKKSTSSQATNSGSANCQVRTGNSGVVNCGVSNQNTPTSGSSDLGGGGLSQSDKISIGVGLGVGIPSILLTIGKCVVGKKPPKPQPVPVSVPWTLI
jgi:hypothetical protein